jgi:transcriptional regulator with XRE-family HTH domain
MTARERAVDRARRRSAEQLAALARELREARISAGRTQADVAAAARISTSELSRIELGQTAGVQLETVAAVGAVIGLDVSLRVYPGGHVLRDGPQLRLLRALRRELGDGWSWRYEVPVAAGDQRAWDLVGRCRATGVVIVVEAETRIRDTQLLLRRVVSKRAAAGCPRVIVLVADTRNNRAALAAAADVLASEFPIGTRSTLRALRDGQLPPDDCLIVLRPESA